MALATEVIWLHAIARKAVFEVERDQRWYSGVDDDNVEQPADVPANMVDDLDYFARSRRLGILMMGDPLQLTNVQFLPNLWHGFQRQFLLRHPFLPNLQNA